jgi:hypothetical protein
MIGTLVANTEESHLFPAVFACVDMTTRAGLSFRAKSNRETMTSGQIADQMSYVRP